tara:strand:+ start:141973 stop:142704 length:732 start_codon:yes stop_codon:yes gene_type:complete
MKTSKTIFLIAAILLAVPSYAARTSKKSASESMNSLGADKDILKKVRSYKSRHKVRVVQKRAVDRDLRLELGINYGAYSGGSAYTNTTGLGGLIDFHITPKWSLGVRYTKFDNSLNSEGQEIFDRNSGLVLADEVNSTNLPSVDRPLEAQYAVLSWYPLYGKLNFFDSAVAQFDIYTLIGGGQVKLDSGSSSAMIYGGGLGVWLSNHFSTRLEVNYQTYKDQLQQDPREQDMLTVMLSLGWLI